MRLGFACHWGTEPERTWSGTPWRLREALRAGAEVVDIGAAVPELLRRGLRLAGARPTPTGWRSQWHHGRTAGALLQRDIRRRVASERPDVVLEIGDLASLPEVPHLVLQDLSYALLRDRFGADIPHFHAVSRRRLEELERRQERICAEAAALLPLSQWLADAYRRDGVPASRLRVVHPGVNVPIPADRPVPLRRRGTSRRLLMVGRDFERKGGVQVLHALALLRRDWDRPVELTIAGPREWPLRGVVPDGVTFLGPQSPERVAALLDEHDLFVMPSLFEAFGIVFAEALCRGLPCVGRDDCAMPEIIDHGTGGRLVRTEDPHELADTIAAALADDALYRDCARLAPERARHFNWSRAADDVLAVAADVTG
ncbi:MAG: glycosyltransferase family 4 protein [Propionibacteriaceae bacterium]